MKPRQKPDWSLHWSFLDKLVTYTFLSPLPSTAMTHAMLYMFRARVVVRVTPYC